MKNLFLIIIILISNLSIAQIAFGKITVDGSGIIDFNENTNQGILLPWMENRTAVTHSAGTIAYDVTDKKVKWYNGTDWQDLSVKEGTINTSETDGFSEIGEGIIIGESTNAPEGVLVLNDSTKAIILPKNTSWENIKNPEPGTIMYDTTNNLMCVYSGSQWTFWGL